jgi:cytoskeleton protein RodZ
LLRQTRQSYGGEIERIATALRIRAPYLTAIEEGRYDRLPGPVYALGFVRAYAIHLGLDGDEAVRRFKQETTGFEISPDLSFPVPLVPRSIPGGTMVLAALILAICGYGLWYYLSTGERARPERVSNVPTDLVPKSPNAARPDTPPAPPAANKPEAPAATPPAVATASPEAAPPPPPAAPPAVTATPAPSPAATPAPPPVATASAVPEAAVAGSAPEAAPTVAPSAAAPPAATDQNSATNAAAPAALAAATPARPADGPKVYGAAEPGRVVIRATGDCWVQVRDRTQAVVLQRVLHAGDTYLVPDTQGLSMRTGNGSALQVAVDGRPAPAIGGTVRHNVLLDPDRLASGTAVSE